MLYLHGKGGNIQLLKEQLFKYSVIKYSAEGAKSSMH